MTTRSSDRRQLKQLLASIRHAEYMAKSWFNMRHTWTAGQDDWTPEQGYLDARSRFLKERATIKALRRLFVRATERYLKNYKGK